MVTRVIGASHSRIGMLRGVRVGAELSVMAFVNVVSDNKVVNANIGWPSDILLVPCPCTPPITTATSAPPC